MKKLATLALIAFFSIGLATANNGNDGDDKKKAKKAKTEAAADNKEGTSEKTEVKKCCKSAGENKSCADKKAL